MGSWPSLLVNAGVDLIVVAAIVAFAIGLVRIAPTFVSRGDWAIVAALSAALAAFFALLQSNRAGIQQARHEAVMLGSSSALVSSSLRLIERPLPREYRGPVLAPFVLPATIARSRVEQLRQVLFSLNALPADQMLSSTMTIAVTRARIGVARALTIAEASGAAGTTTDFDDAAGELIAASSLLDQERQARYPMYKLGRYGFTFGPYADTVPQATLAD